MRCFFMPKGNVDIIHQEGDERQHIATIEQYDSFGELGILSDYPRTAGAIANGHVQI